MQYCIRLRQSCWGLFDYNLFIGTLLFFEHLKLLRILIIVQQRGFFCSYWLCKTLERLYKACKLYIHRKFLLTLENTVHGWLLYLIYSSITAHNFIQFFKSIRVHNYCVHVRHCFCISFIEALAANLRYHIYISHLLVVPVMNKRDLLASALLCCVYGHL